MLFLAARFSLCFSCVLKYIDASSYVCFLCVFSKGERTSFAFLQWREGGREGERERGE